MTAGLPEEERLALGAAGPRRCREFAAGRNLARQLLAQAGLPVRPIGRGPGRAPQWPPGVVGSITHSGEFAAAAVAPADRLWSVGLDLEDPGRMHARLAEAVLTAPELACYRTLPEAEARTFAATAFSVKEAFFKLQYPLTGLRPGFADAALSRGADGCYRLRAPAPFGELTPQLRRCPVSGWLLALLALPRERFRG